MKASTRGPDRSVARPEDGDAARLRGAPLVAVAELRAADDVETCLRPLGLCELGGACDSCWYRPDHPRFKSSA